MSDFVENIKRRGVTPFQTTGAISIKTPLSIDGPHKSKGGADMGGHANTAGNYDILKIISKKRNSS